MLGRTGLAILERAAGLLLVAIAIQFMIDGLGDALPARLFGRRRFAPPDGARARVRAPRLAAV